MQRCRALTYKWEQDKEVAYSNICPTFSGVKVNGNARDFKHQTPEKLPSFPQRTTRCLPCQASAWMAILLIVSLRYSAECSVPAGCKPPELVISREHPLIILYGPGSGELTVKCWQNLPSNIKPYCAVTMDPSSLDIKERLESWRRMLKIVQPHNIPIVLQVAGDEPEWTTPLGVVARLLD